MPADLGMKHPVVADTSAVGDAAHAGIADAQHDETIAEQAARWIVELSVGDATVRDATRHGFDAWKQADPRHAAMAERLQEFIGRVKRLGGMEGNGNDNNDSCNPNKDGKPRAAQAARAALTASFVVDNADKGAQAKLSNGSGRTSRPSSTSSTKRLITTMALALSIAVPVWLAVKVYPLPYMTYMMADMRSATGKWESRVLADGTRMTLNSASAVNLHFDAQRRVLELVQGEILVDVAKDPERPFIVETVHGSIRALGTRFVVSRDSDATVLSMLESRVEVRTFKADPRQIDAATVVSAGQRVRMTANGVGPIEQIDARSIADSWKFHQLVVQEQSLPEVLDALDRYRPGVISYDRAQIESIKVTALLPLDDTGRALTLLNHSFPGLRVRTLSPYLVRVDMPVQLAQPALSR